jgi:hypothetical protein
MMKKYRFKFTSSEVLTVRVRINNDLKILPHLDMFKHELSEAELDRLFEASDEDYTPVVQQFCCDQYITKIRAMLRYEKHKYSVNGTIPIRLKRSSISTMKNIIFKEKLTEDDRADIIDRALELYLNSLFKS